MLLWSFLFTTFTVIFGAAVFVWWHVENERRRQRLVRNLASTVDPESGGVRTTVLIENPDLRGGLANLFKSKTSPSDTGGKAGYSKGKFSMLALGTVFAGFLIGSKLTGIIGPSAPVIVAVVIGGIPWAYRSKHRNKRLNAIEEQFPEALDFLARSVRAGNAFSIGLELLAAEAREPLKSEFLKLTREMALGAGIEDALHGLIARVPIFEVRFFVAAVLLQRETGGNLSEVLGKLAIAVRERVRLRGQVKAASGQGRLTARVLTFLPIGTMIMLKFLSPAYMDAMTDDPLGRNLLAMAVVSQLLGYFVMQKIIRIEV